MPNSADSVSSTSRPVIIYIIVAVVLFAALVLGVRWAKSRADYYAQQQTSTSKTQTASSNGPGQTENPSQGTEATPSTSQPTPSVHNESQNASPSKPSVASTTPAAPAHVPSTGPEQVFLTLGSLSVCAFAAASYVRARRRLQGLAQ
jgi:FtsZ-interacting cell division protein ZipA